MLIRRSAQLGAITLCLLFSVAAASGQAQGSRPVVSHPTRSAISAPMSEAPSASPAARQTIPRAAPDSPQAEYPRTGWGVADCSGRPVNAIPGIQFDGVDYTNPGECAGCDPSDTNIAFGKSHIVQIVNVAVTGRPLFTHTCKPERGQALSVGRPLSGKRDNTKAPVTEGQSAVFKLTG